MDYDHGQIFIAIGIVLVLFISVILIINAINKRRYNEEFPVHTVEAVVVSKHEGIQVIENNKQMPIWYPRSRTQFPAYYITFAEPNGKHMQLMVGEREYHWLDEQDIGELTYQGKLLKKFEKRREADI